MYPQLRHPVYVRLLWSSWSLWHLDNETCLWYLQGGYPAKLKKVLIVTAPLWFKAPFKILRLFVREKLRERVYTVSSAQLQAHIPRESLPTQLGGSLVLDHDDWLEHCLASMSATRGHSPLSLNSKWFPVFSILQNPCNLPEMSSKNAFFLT